MDTILIIDDDSAFRKTTSALLRGQGFSCYEAENGIWALDWLKDHQVHLIITDLDMPGPGGFSFLQKLHQQFNQQPPPVIIISGHITHQEREYAKNGWAGAILNKPFKLEELVATANRLIQERRALEE